MCSTSTRSELKTPLASTAKCKFKVGYWAALRIISDPGSLVGLTLPHRCPSYPHDTTRSSPRVLLRPFLNYHWPKLYCHALLHSDLMLSICTGKQRSSYLVGYPNFLPFHFRARVIQRMETCVDHGLRNQLWSFGRVGDLDPVEAGRWQKPSLQGTVKKAYSFHSLQTPNYLYSTLPSLVL